MNDHDFDLMLRSIMIIDREYASNVPFEEPQRHYANYLYLLSSRLPKIIRPDLIDPVRYELLMKIDKHVKTYHACPSLQIVHDQAEGNEARLAVLDEIFKKTPVVRTDFEALTERVVHKIHRDRLADVLKTGWAISVDGARLLKDGTVTSNRKIGKVVQGGEEAHKYLDSELSRLLRDFTTRDDGFTLTEEKLAEILESEEDPRVLTFPWSQMSGHKIRRHELVLLAAYAGTGKTTCATYLTAWWIANGANGLYLSLEMPVNDMWGMVIQILANRLYSQNISQRDLLERKLSEEHMGYMKAVGKLLLSGSDYGKLKIHKAVGLTVPELKGIVNSYEQELQRQGCTLDFVVIDHIGCMNTTLQIQGGKTEYLNQIIKDLKHMTMEKNLPIIGVFQNNRESQKTIDRSKDSTQSAPKLYNLSYANEGEQHADRVITLHRVSRTNKNEWTMVLQMLKARLGEPDRLKYIISVDLDTKWIEEIDVFADSDQDAATPETPLIELVKLDPD